MKAVNLQIGQYVRNPKKRKHILVVVEVGSVIKAQGYSEKTGNFYWFSKNDEVEVVTI